MSDYAIDKKQFWSRLKLWTDGLKAGRCSGCESVILLNGTIGDEQYKKSAALSLWLWGYEFPETLATVSRSGEMTVYASKRKLAVLSTLTDFDEIPPGHCLVLEERVRGDEDALLSTFKALLDKLRGGEHRSAVRVGTLRRDFVREVGTFATGFRSVFSAATEWLVEVDASNFIGELLAAKSDVEIGHVRTAAGLSKGVMQKVLIRQVEGTIDADSKRTHAQLAAKIADLLEHPEKLSRKLSSEMVEASHPALVQSGAKRGAKYQLELAGVGDSQPASADVLAFDTIVCSLGVRYALYCSTMCRTLFVDAPPLLEKRYALLLELRQCALDALRPGAKMSAAYMAVRERVRDKAPELLPCLLPDVGAPIGLMLCDEQLKLDADNDAEVPARGAFCVRVGFQTASASDSSAAAELRDPANVVMALADTVLAGAGSGESAHILTALPAEWSDVSYVLDAAPASDDDDKKASSSSSSSSSKATPKKKPSVDLETTAKRKRRLEDGEVKKSGGGDAPSELSMAERRERRRREREEAEERRASAEQKRRDHQQQLAEARKREAQERYGKKKSSSSSSSSSSDKKKKTPIAYRSPSQFPSAASTLRLAVDVDKEVLLLPIYGALVPMHISTIKNVTKSEDELQLRLNFVSPALTARAIASDEKYPVLKQHASSVFVRELTYRCGELRHLNDLYRKIQEMRKRVTARETHKRETAGLQRQEDLAVTRGGRVPTLPRVMIRPSLGNGRKTVGNLEVHKNGFRFKPVKAGTASIDILFANVRHAFYQPAGSASPVVIVHFHLHSAIMIGRKRANDVQFYVEVISTSTELNNRRGADDGIEEEHRERLKRRKHNQEFKDFVQDVQKRVPDLEFDIPYEDLGFNGVPNRSNVFLQPTVNCLIHLVDAPFFVITLDDIEVAYFERVQFSLRAFDLVFVFKDYDRLPIRIDAIPVGSLESIKDWLNECNILYFEGAKNLNWRTVMSNVREDVEGFWEMGGWTYVLSQESGDDMPDDDESDEFDPDSDELESDDSDDSDDYASSSDSDDSSDDGRGGDDSSDDEVADWDELERQAKRDDSKRARDWDGGERPSSSSSSSSRRRRRR
jgi:FACT complex subunit SPT16